MVTIKKAADNYVQGEGDGGEAVAKKETDEEKACRILGVHPNTTADQIKRIYKALAPSWHPDTNTTVTDDTRIKEINWAYDFLMKLRN